MRHKWITTIALWLLVASSSGCLYRYHSSACKARGAAYAAKYEKIKRDAPERLKIGTKKEDVIRFFEENGIPVTFVGDEADGTVPIIGCAPSGCGTDEAFIGLRVKVDKAGTVIGEPRVGGFYTNCL